MSYHRKRVLRLYESIQLIRPIDLDMSDEGLGICKIEVFINGDCRLSHGERGLEQEGIDSQVLNSVEIALNRND